MLRKVAVSLGDQAIVSATNFATSVVLGKCCDNESLGVYYLALSVAYFIRGLQEQLIAAPYMIYANKCEPARLPRYSGSVLVHELVLMLVTCGIISGSAWWVADGSELGRVLWILAGAAPLMLVREFARQFSFARMNLASAMALDTTVGILQIAVLLALAGTGTLTTSTAFLAIALSVALPTLCWLTFWRGTFQASPTATIEDARQNWTFGKWAVASTLLACIASYTLPWVLKFYDGEGAAGILGAATTLAGLANMFVLGMSNFFAPRAARAYATGGVSSLRTVLLKAAALYSVVLGPLVICALLAGDQVMRLVYRDGLDGAGQIIAVLALGQWINSIGITAGNGLWAIERPAANFAADAVNLAATFAITVLLLLVGWLDPLGAAAATVAGLAVGAIARTLILLRHLKGLESAGTSRDNNGSPTAESCPC
jgi:O-antigen/teichoic acid export membrane protein